MRRSIPQKFKRARLEISMQASSPNSCNLARSFRRSIQNCAAFPRCTPKRHARPVRSRFCSERNGSWADFTMSSLSSARNSRKRCRRSMARMSLERRPITTMKNPSMAISCSRNCSGESRKFTSRSTARVKGILLRYGHTTDYLPLDKKDAPTFSTARKAAEKAFGMANLKPRDMQGAEVHDCFSITEIVAYEILGLAEPGNGVELVKSGATTLPQVRNQKSGKLAFEI